MNILEKLLTPNKMSRPQTKIGKIKKIVIHWVGNAKSTAIANRNYFDNLRNQTKTYASSHYIIGLDGEVILCVPENEVAYHAKQANSYSIGIEVCHPDWGGKFSDKTYQSLVELCADLCKKYDLNPTTDIIRHYDVTGKDCPAYYVKNPTEFLKLKQDVNQYLKNKGVNKVNIRLKLNGKEKIVSAMQERDKEGNITNYVKLRDLADDKIEVGYDGIPTVKVK